MVNSPCWWYLPGKMAIFMGELLVSGRVCLKPGGCTKTGWFWTTLKGLVIVQYYYCSPPGRYKIHWTSGGRSKQPLERVLQHSVYTRGLFLYTIELYRVAVRTTYTCESMRIRVNQQTRMFIVDVFGCAVVAPFCCRGNCQLEPLVEGSGCKRLLTE